MSSPIDRLFVLFVCFFAGFIALLIGYAATPTLILFGCCWAVGTLTVVAGMAAAVFWAKGN
jgi:hypothetical protein